MATLNTRVHGSGKPDLVFIHGFSRDQSDWHEQVAGLAAAQRCVLLDLPGHGASALLGQQTIEDHAAAVLATLAELDLHEVLLVGHSMGCRVAVEACRQDARRIAGLICIDGSRVAGDNAVSRLEANVTGPGAMERFLDGFYQDFYVDTTSAAVRAFIEAGRGKVDLDMARRLIINFVRWDNEASIDALKAVAAAAVPLLLIQSTALDATMKRVPIPAGTMTPWMTAVAAHVPGAQIEIVAGVGHFTQLEAPARVNALITAFARRIVGG